jgi:hypothetical protein
VQFECLNGTGPVKVSVEFPGGDVLSERPLVAVSPPERPVVAALPPEEMVLRGMEAVNGGAGGTGSKGIAMRRLLRDLADGLKVGEIRGYTNDEIQARMVALGLEKILVGGGHATQKAIAKLMESWIGKTWVDAQGRTCRMDKKRMRGIVVERGGRIERVERVQYLFSGVAESGA